MQEDPNQVVAKAVKESRDLLKAGEVQGAYQALVPILRYPGVTATSLQLTAAMDAFADVATQLADEEFGAVMRKVAKGPDDANALFEAGYALYEQEQYAVAATLLARANKLQPGSADIVMELAVCLESLGLNEDALAVLKASDADDGAGFMPYLIGFNAMMTGDINEAKSRVNQLRARNDDEVAPLIETLEGMLARAEAIGAKVSLKGAALTAWHAILNGSVLLHESPAGYPEPMGGRYAFVADSPSLMKEGIVAVEDVLKRADIEIKGVMATPDRESQILAAATAKALELPLLSWGARRTPNNLIVCWSLESVTEPAVIQSISGHSPGEVLWVHASNWVTPFHFAPDITTYLYQEVTHPYSGGAMKVDTETNEVTIAEPDSRSVEELAQEILAAEIEDPSAADPLVLERILDSCRALPAKHAMGVFLREGQRAIQRTGGPVKSNRFL